MDFLSDSIAEAEDLLDVNRGFCKMKMTKKISPSAPLNCAVLPKLHTAKTRTERIKNKEMFKISSKKY